MKVHSKSRYRLFYSVTIVKSSRSSTLVMAFKAKISCSLVWRISSMNAGRVLSISLIEERLRRLRLLYTTGPTRALFFRVRRIFPHIFL